MRSPCSGSPRSPRRWAGRFSSRLGLGDVLFGRKKLKGANLDRLFALIVVVILILIAVAAGTLTARFFMAASRAAGGTRSHEDV